MKKYFFKSDWVIAKTNFKIPTESLKNKEKILFWDKKNSVGITYKDLEKYGIRDCLYRIKNSLNFKKMDGDGLREIIGLLGEWRNEVDLYYTPSIWYKYEWYYPLIKKINKKK
jgi:hypothetical protein